MTDIAIRVENMGKRYRLGERERYRALRDSLAEILSPVRLARKVTKLASGAAGGEASHWALKNLSLEVRRGEVVGVIGRNGAGKSTLLKILSRITSPTEGEAVVYGRVGSLLEVGTGFHPELTGRENVYLNGAILGMRRAEIRRKFDEIVAFAEIEKFLDTPVKRYSSGMYVRLAFAVAAHLEPEILLVDEVLAVGDAAFQQKCLGKMGSVAKGGRTVLFVSHNMAAVQNLCEVCHLLDDGKLVASGTSSEVVARYLQLACDTRRSELGDRTDRQGDGRLVFKEFSAKTRGRASATIACGDPVSLELRYSGRAPLKNVHVSVGVYNLLGDGVLYLSNDLAGSQLEQLPPDGALVCKFDKLPLLPGVYSVNVYCTVNGVLADWVTDAATLHVDAGDYYGTGRLPPTGYGSVVVPYRWDVVDAG